MQTSTAAAPISLDREGPVFRLAFPYREELVAAVRSLPYAAFDTDTKSWTCSVCIQSVESLRQWFMAGSVDTNVDSLLEPGESLPVASAAVLRSGAGKKPYVVAIGIRDDRTFTRLRAVVGANWDKRLGGLTYPSSSAAALSDLVQKGIVSDPESLLTRDGAVVMFDSRTGQLSLNGNDSRAKEVFAKHFPNKDVVDLWKEKGLEVDFLDDFTKSMYQAELARIRPRATPEGFKIELYPHQNVSYSMAVTREGHAVFDEPGLGKSATAIAAGFTLLREGRAERVIVVVPASVRTQWKAEIERFTGMSDIVIVKGDKKERYAAYEDATSNRWLIVHYDVLARDQKQLKGAFTGAYVVADEAHRIKSRTAARTKALKELSKYAVGRLALTGTPVETSPEEWFEILSGWAIPGCLGSPYEFNERYRWKNRWGGYEGARNVVELANRSHIFYTRHTKREVAKHLPPLSVHNKILDPNPAYASALRKAHADAVKEIREAALNKAAAKTGANTADLSLLDPELASEVSDGAEMTAVGLLRLLCSSPRIVEDSDSASASAMREAGLIPDEDGPKVDEIRAVASGLKAVRDKRISSGEEGQLYTPEEVTGERVVIFTFSKRMANLLAERLEEDGVNALLYTGDTSHADRDQAVADFTDPNSGVQVLISTDAGAEGLNLGKCCNLLINVDLPWTAARMEQRAQRIHRLDGTAAKYEVVNLTIASTMESGILRLLQSRANLTDALFGEEGGARRAVGKRGSGDLLNQALQDFDKDQ